MRVRVGIALTAVALLAVSEPAYSHGIAGNRYFAGTLTFDDPAVADEAILPYYDYLSYPAQGSAVVENRINWSFDRLLIPTLAVTYDSGWMHQNWPVGRTSGFDSTDVGLKYEAYRNNQHEALVSVGLAWGVGYSGSEAVGADEPNTIQPGVFFGKLRRFARPAFVFAPVRRYGRHREPNADRLGRQGSGSQLSDW